MDVIIKETGEVKKLVIIDQNTGVEWTSHLINNEVLECDDNGTIVMSQDDYDWWVDIIVDMEENDRLALELIEELEESGLEPPKEGDWHTYVGVRLAEAQDGDLEFAVKNQRFEIDCIREEFLD